MCLEYVKVINPILPAGVGGFNAFGHFIGLIAQKKI